ncbi:MAG: hypothetical protein IJ435_03845 [Clostridia bacterium]|nr:hypothetical protein [Clostridia bacterium]
MEKYITVFVSGIGILSIFVEISKIKLNPWGKLFEFIGSSLNRDVKNELDNIKGLLKSQSEGLKELEMTVDMNEIKRIRAEIFAFADSCKMGEKHTEEAFLHIIDIHEDYEELIEKYGLTNGRISLDYEYIVGVYQDCVKKKVF